MKDTLIDIGEGHHVNINLVVCVMDSNADKARRFLQKQNLNRSSEYVLDATSNKETKSIVLFTDGRVALSNKTANLLVKYANKEQ